MQKAVHVTSEATVETSKLTNNARRPAYQKAVFPPRVEHEDGVLKTTKP
jgi:hypothetical protein